MTTLLADLRTAIDAYSDFAYTLETRKTVTLDGLGDFTYVTGEGGGEGEGENVWIVFEHDGNLLRLTGYYSSYDGTEWGEDYGSVLDFVAPRIISVTVYDHINLV